MKKILYITSIIIVIISIIFIYCTKETIKISEYFNIPSQSAVIPQVDIQKNINNELESISNDVSYTIESPYIKLNPYEISPLSAIIIFTTKQSQNVEVYINDSYFTKMESSTKHTIPIYGLYEDYLNEIILKSSNKEYKYYIKTGKSNIEYPLEILKNTEKNDNNDIIFTVASYKTYLTGWDKNGKLRFYLTVDNRMDVEWLDNGHFLVGTSQGQVRENFVGLVEMDYLGKIYNYYTLEHGYGFEIQILDNGNYMLAGGDVPIYFNHQYIYQMDKNTGKTIDYLDIYDVIKQIDSNFPDEYLGPKAIRNGFYYDEASGEVVVSFREINTVFSFDYKAKKLNYVFTTKDNKLYSDPVWDKYLIKVKNGRYPLGQHTPTITKEGYLALFNNGYDRYGIAFDNKSDLVGNYNNCYTSVEIYDIKDNVANLVWQYDFDKKYFSIKYGLFNILKDNHKFMNYGYVLKDEFRKNKNNSLVEVEKDVKDIYSLITELDENDNIVFQAKSAEGKYRAFNNKLYLETTKNIDLSDFNIYDALKKDNLTISSLKNLDIESAYEWINTFEFTKNTLTTDFNIKATDEVQIHFLNNRGKVFTLNYKDKNNTQLNRIFNVNLSKEKYRVYISINDQLYDVKKVYSF